MAIGIAFVLWKAKQERLQNNFQTTTVTFESKPLSNQHTAMLTVLIIGVAFMVYLMSGNGKPVHYQLIICS